MTAFFREHFNATRVIINQHKLSVLGTFVLSYFYLYFGKNCFKFCHTFNYTFLNLIPENFHFILRDVFYYVFALLLWSITHFRNNKNNIKSMIHMTIIFVFIRKITLISFSPLFKSIEQNYWIGPKYDTQNINQNLIKSTTIDNSLVGFFWNDILLTIIDSFLGLFVYSLFWFLVFLFTNIFYNVICYIFSFSRK